MKITSNDFLCFDVLGILWTEKYAPSKIDEVIGNWDTCKKLRDWLNEWKKVTGSAYSAKLTRDGEDTTSNSE